MTLDIDIAHALVTGIVIFVVVYAVEHTSLLAGASRIKRVIIGALTVFVAVLLIDLVWPV